MKNKKAKNLISFILFFVLLFLAIIFCSNLFEYKEARKIYKPFFNSKTNFDVIFLGTSHMYNHVLPMELWKQKGISSYNWGYSNSTPCENYYLLKDIIKYTSPKVVVADAVGIFEYENENNKKYRTDRIEQQHVQFDKIPFSLDKYEGVKYIFDDYKDNIDFLWNFIMYHNRWNELTKDDFKYEISKEMGAKFITGLGEKIFPQYTPINKSQIKNIDTTCLYCYLKTIDFCQEHNIKFLAVYIPFNASEITQQIANYLGTILKKYPNANYKNFLRNKSILNLKTDLCPDNYHLNYSGALKATKKIGRYLTKHYKLDDYSKNEYWIDNYKKYLKYKIKVLKEQKFLPSYLVQLTSDDFIVKAKVFKKELLDNKRILGLFKNAKIEHEISNKQTDTAVLFIVRKASNNEIIDKSKFEFDPIFKNDIFKIVRIKKKKNKHKT